MSSKIARNGQPNRVLNFPFPFFLAFVLVAGCSAPRVSQKAFRADKLAAMDTAIESAIASNKCPGGVLWLERDGENGGPLEIYHKAYGNRALVPAREPMTENTIFDMASLTKVCATTPAVMLLVQRGKIDLDAPVKTYIPEFTGDGKENVTVRELMTHTSGLPPDIETKTDWHSEATAIQKACAEKLDSPPGTAFKYSDINFEMLGEIVQRVSQMPLEDFVQREIYRPLKMMDTRFLPMNEKIPAEELARIAPTEVYNGGASVYRGVVHDPTARHMGGVAGHAGLFSTASDVARYARMLLNSGELDGVRVFKPETVKLMTTVQSPPDVSERRGLGWDIDSPFAGPRGNIFPLGSYGHTGWTGGSLWIDPFSKTIVIFLSNRNHPTEAGNVIALRRRLGTLAAESVVGFDFENVPGALKAAAK